MELAIARSRPLDHRDYEAVRGSEAVVAPVRMSDVEEQAVMTGKPSRCRLVAQ
jgi:hypothetical protein